MVSQLVRSKLFGPLVETASHQLRIMVVEAEWNAVSQSVSLSYSVLCENCVLSGIDCFVLLWSVPAG